MNSSIFRQIFYININLITKSSKPYLSFKSLYNFTISNTNIWFQKTFNISNIDFSLWESHRERESEREREREVWTVKYPVRSAFKFLISHFTDPKKINTILLSVTQISVAENLQYFKHRFQLVTVSQRERKRARTRERGMNS